MRGFAVDVRSTNERIGRSAHTIGAIAGSAISMRNWVFVRRGFLSRVWAVWTASLRAPMGVEMKSYVFYSDECLHQNC